MRRFLSRSLPGILLIGMLVWPGAYCPGIVSTADHGRSAVVAGQLGAKVVRAEFSVCAPASSLDSTVRALADNGAQLLPLAGFHSTMPSSACALGLGAWADRFGQGGTFWDTYSGTDLPISHIEFGNETSYCHQYPPPCPGTGLAGDPYCERAKTYATRAAEAVFALGGPDGAVKLLAQAEDGGTGSANWVNCMYDAVPDLHALTSGWTVHPYGPESRWRPKLQRLIDFTAVNGAPASEAIHITEYGLSSDNGATVSPDNYGWPANQTYVQAASALESAVAGIRGMLGDRLVHFMIYAAYDLRAPGVKECGGLACREQYFGAVRNDLTDKGAYSVEVRDQLDDQ